MKKRLGILGCMAASVMLLMGASGGCGSNLHKAIVASGSIAASLHSAAVANHNNTFESDDERQAIAGYIVSAASANDNLLGVLSAAQNNGGKIDPAVAVDAFSKLSTEINQLNEQGVLHLKSAQAQADYALFMSSLQAELAFLQTLYGSPTSENHLPRHNPYAPFFAITLTSTEIEELIAIAVSVGSTLVPKLMQLRGESDAQILAAAEEDDKAAIAQAEADGAKAEG
jgi:hypothetical protein